MYVYKLNPLTGWVDWSASAARAISLDWHAKEWSKDNYRMRQG